MLKPAVILCTSLLILGCEPGVPTATPSAGPAKAIADAAHNARNSLDWAGSYQGMLPCADCEAINTTLTLYHDGRYQLQQLYVGKSTAPFVQQGQFSWNPAGSTVLLDGGEAQQFFVGENQLFMLDQQGNRIEGELAARYRLAKQQG
ncbi:copper resistance protein NlpE [Rheinheimera pleomorphica]|uniref:copper resistance protein NlpE n=1 Tax=Rheinheimera pleomorphica TaxID=2703963 RepID=UPI00141E2AC3|nr:copper resistance protein NlpE [Rheinheimera pleomorphica]